MQDGVLVYKTLSVKPERLWINWGGCSPEFIENKGDETQSTGSGTGFHRVAMETKERMNGDGGTFVGLWGGPGGCPSDIFYLFYEGRDTNIC